MTSEEAIKQLKTMISVYNEGKCTVAMGIAVEALEKQIPKKPIKDEYGCYRSSCCGYAVEYEAKVKGCIDETTNRDSFCCRCGQAVDWSEEE